MTQYLEMVLSSDHTRGKMMARAVVKIPTAILMDLKIPVTPSDWNVKIIAYKATAKKCPNKMLGLGFSLKTEINVKLVSENKN